MSKSKLTISSFRVLVQLNEKGKLNNQDLIYVVYPQGERFPQTMEQYLSNRGNKTFFASYIFGLFSPFA